MSLITRRSALAVIAAGSCAAGLQVRPGCAVTADFDQSTAWPSFRRTPDLRGIATTVLAADPQLLWEFRSKDGWVGVCAIVDDHVYAPALEGFLYCLDRRTGTVIWKYRSIDSPDEDEFAPGFKAAPLVTSEAVYAGDEDGILHVVDRKSGERRWQFTTEAEIAGGVAIWKDRLIVASHDSWLYCLSLDGDEVWKFQTNDRINCSPAIADHYTFVAGCDSQLRVIDLEQGEEVLGVEMGDYLIASPAVVDDVLYVGSHGGEVSAVNWKDGTAVWSYSGRRQLSIRASAVATDDLILVGSHDKLMHAIDRRTGVPRWTFPTRARIESSAAVVDSRVFFGSGDGNIYGLSVADGSQQWKFNAGHAISAGIAIGEECLVVGEDDVNGRLLCFT